MRLSFTRHKRCAGKRIPWLDRRTVDRLGRAARSVGPSGGGVDLVVVDDAYIRELNRSYRGIDRATDVLSFSYSGEGAPPDGPTADGDEPGDGSTGGEVYVSHETVERNARADGVPPEHLFLRVGVHGLLHVLGYDHEKSRDARRMETEEKRILLEHLTPTEVEELF